MIGRIDPHGRVELPGCIEAPARRKRWWQTAPTIIVWGLAVLLMLSLTASVTVALRQALIHPTVPAQELILGPGLGSTR